MEYLFVSGGSIAFFLLFLVFGKSGKSKADFAFLSIIFSVLLYFVGLLILNTGGTIFSLGEQLVLEFNEASIFLYGPLLWYYSLFLTESRQKLTPEVLMHVFPFLVSLLYLWVAASLGYQVETSFRNFLLLMKLTSVLVYTLLILSLLKKHDIRIRDYFSNLDDKKLYWLKFLAQGILFIAVIATLSLIIENLTPLSLPQYGGLFTNFSITLFIFVLGFYGLRQDFIFKNFTTDSLEKIKYSKSGLSDDGSQRGFLKLEEYMRKQKPYVEAELNLEQLAHRLDLHPNSLSQIINSNTESNFWDYVNAYRLEEVKAILNSDEIKTKTLLGIAFSCGFSSKSTFNRVFKKHCGITPSEYVRRQKTDY